jgi:ribosome biogenesis GTPase
LSRECYFRDCNHRDEPHCAVREALNDGTLDSERFGNFQKLQKEMQYLERKRDVVAQSRERNRWKKLTRLAKERSYWKRK